MREIQGRACGFGGVAFLLAGAVSTAAAAQQSAVASLMFDGVTVVDIEQGELVPNQRVVIVGNRIATVGGGSAVKLPIDRIFSAPIRSISRAV